MPGRAGDDEALLIERLRLQRRGESVRLRQQRHVKFPLQQQLAQPVGYRLDQRDFHARIVGPEPAEEADEPHRPDGAHHPQPKLRAVQPQEARRGLLRLLGAGQHLGQMRLEQAAKLGQVRVVALAREQQTAEFVLHLLDRPGQGGLADVADLSRLGEVQRLAER